MFEMIEGGVTSAEGFEAAGGAAGIKKNGSADMALIYCKKPCIVAGTFTSNQVKAAPVKWDRALVKEGREARAIVVNSGIANACTGKEGMDACAKTADAAAQALGIDASSVLVATTDRVHKEIAVNMTFSDGSMATLGGCTKGSGMIHPNMCTMLCFLTTDASISRDMLQKALSSVVPDTFNMVSVDGDTSTNDTCLLLSDGLAGNPEITAEDSDDYRTFTEALRFCAESLGKKMAKDGEGATCLFECDVIHADTKEHAKKLARSVVSSTLTKAAIAGHDANWGRILCALGYCGVDFDPEQVTLTLESSAGRLVIYENGSGTGYSEEKATEILSQDEIHAICDMHMGDFDASAWGCDLTHEYVNINADYRS